MHIIGIFHESKLIAHYASGSEVPQKSALEDTLKELGHELLIGNVQLVVLPAEVMCAEDSIHAARERQFSHSNHGEDADVKMAAFYGNAADRMAELFETVFNS